MDTARVDAYREAEEWPLVELTPAIAETVEWLARFGADAGGGVTRLLYDASWLEAQMTLSERLRQLGLTVYTDEVGNLHGVLRGTDPEAAAVWTGSHIDTVRRGGKYDGAYGIAAGLIAMLKLAARYGPPRRDVHLVSFCEEEGSRFPLAYWGSGYVTGRFSLDAIPEAYDAEGISLTEAMQAAGFGPGSGTPLPSTPPCAYIELHIEQGAVLERERTAIGLVQGIVGQKRLTFEVTGCANHAGTTPMTMRCDALAGVAEMILATEQRGNAYGPPLVATVGSLDILPNLTNVIPGHVAFTLDARHADSTELTEFCEELMACYQDIADKRGLTFTYKEWMDAPAVMLDRELLLQLTGICRRKGLSHRVMFSGAGHDAQLMQALCPSTMVFVPSRGGISHSPDEYTADEDLAVGVQVLIDFLHGMAYEDDDRAEAIK